MSLPEGRPYPSKVTERDVVNKDKSRLTVLEGTDLKNQAFRLTMMRASDEAFTRDELMRVRAEIADAVIPRHHGKTPLPIPKQ